MGEPSRRRVSYCQLESLWEFLNSRREIALGYNKTAQARAFSRRMWEEVALSLNSQGDGAQKDWKGWCKYWNDYKSKLKKAAAANRRSMQQTGGGPPAGKPMTEIELKFIQLLGDNFGLGLPGIMVEPFEEELHDNQEVEEGSGPIVAGGSESILTGMHLIPLSPPAPVDANQPGPSWQGFPIPIPATPIPTSPLPDPASPPRPPPATAAPLPSTPRSSPRRRRLRREPPLTTEAARRALLRDSQRRADLEEREAQRRAVVDDRNSAMLRELVDDVKEIKNMFRRWTETYGKGLLSKFFKLNKTFK